MHLRLEIVDQEDGNYNSPGDEGWDHIVVELTPARIEEYVRDRDGALLSTACGSGREPLVNAFLKLAIVPILRLFILMIRRKYMLVLIHRLYFSPVFSII